MLSTGSNFKSYKYRIFQFKECNVLFTSINSDSGPMYGELTQAVKDLNLPDSLPIDEFLNYPEEEKTYEIPDSDGLIEELIKIYKQPYDICIDDGDIDDSVESVIVNANDAANGLEIVRSFLQQQQDSKELLKQVRMLERYISLKSVNVMKIDESLIISKNILSIPIKY